ncbi:MAG TPA: tol-pal system protein YbgF [bacterium]|nr:tol-pal system protein YbgF [bacterium]
MKIEQLSRSIRELEARNQKLLARTKGGEFDIESQEGLADKLLQIDDRLALLEDRMDFIDSTRFDLLTRIDQLESRLEGGGVATAPGTTRSMERESAGRALSESEYKNLYQRAYELYRQKNYQQAIPEFIRVIDARPDGDLSDNAQYWIGECYYGMQNFNRAIVEFEKVFTFKNSNKDADAQLKLGLCYLNLGQREKAREEFQRLVDFYPNSEYRSVATKYLQQL